VRFVNNAEELTVKRFARPQWVAKIAVAFDAGQTFVVVGKDQDDDYSATYRNDDGDIALIWLQDGWIEKVPDSVERSSVEQEVLRETRLAVEEVRNANNSPQAILDQLFGHGDEPRQPETNETEDLKARTTQLENRVRDLTRRLMRAEEQLREAASEREAAAESGEQTVKKRKK